MSRIGIVATLAGALIALGGCAEKDEQTSPAGTQRLDVMLDFFPNADHVGLYAALADGDFERAGLDVRPQVPSDPSAPLKLLSAERVDLAISYEPELLLARDKGADLVAVGAIVQEPLTSIIALPGSGVRRPADLAGKTVGTAGIPYQTAYLNTILEDADADPLSVEEVNVGFNLTPAMLTGRVDATLGSFWNYEGTDLRLKGRDPTIIPVDDAGIPPYNELIVVARAGDVSDEARGELIRRFMRALGQGYEAAREDPERAVGQLVAANPDLEPRLQLAVVEATLPVFFPADEELPFGYMDRRRWAAYAAWMFDQELVARRPDVEAAVTNRFLPGLGI